MEEKKNALNEVAFQEYYSNIKNRINHIIEECGEKEFYNNIMIAEAMKKLRSLHADGKRMRGILVYIGYQIVSDGDIREADALAAAFEMFQTSVLIQDDVFDHSESRRGHKTVHKQYYDEFIQKNHENHEQMEVDVKEMGNSVAICIGDIGLYMAEQMLTDAYQQHPYFGKILTYYHKMLINTIQGELIDVQLPCIERYGLWNDKALTNDRLEQIIWDIYYLKTSCYTIIGPLCSGMLLGGAEMSLIEKMEMIGNKVGVAFQLQDDILGIFGAEEKIGKDIGTDISEFKQTILYAYVRSKGGSAYQELLKFYGQDNLSSSEIDRVRHILIETGALEYTKQMIGQSLKEARDMLEQLDDIKEIGRKLLIEFIFNLMDRRS